jgi:hypothetical protein
MIVKLFIACIVTVNNLWKLFITIIIVLIGIVLYVAKALATIVIKLTSGIHLKEISNGQMVTK